MNAHDADVIVIGGGASGLMAAVTAAQLGVRVLLLEKNKNLGVKLAQTGGGRCNILNAEPNLRTLLAHYGEAVPFLFSPFSQFGMPETYEWFEAHGLPLKVEAGNRAFPVSEQASDVVALFASLIKELNVKVEVGVSVTDLVVENGSVIGLKTSKGHYSASSYILATGGLSHPDTGSTGDGQQWLQQLGLPVVAPNPALVPLIVSEAWVQSLAGVSLPLCGITYYSKDGEKETVVGRLLFTHFGLSGPVVLNSAAIARRYLEAGPVTTTINLFPRLHLELVHQEVSRVFATHQNKLVKNVLRYLVPAGLSGGIAGLVSDSLLETPVHSVSRADRIGLGVLLTALPCTVTATKGNDWSIVSDGGLALEAVDTKTMAVRAYPNLFVTGDILHIARPSGGYSLQLCWTTGVVAGRAAAKFLVSL